MDVKVRRANRDDLETLADLFDGYRRFYGQTSDVSGARKFLESRFAAEDSVIFLAEGQQGIGGFTQLYPSFSSVSMRRIWILNDLFVDPRHRRQGLGHALMNAAEQFARDDDAKGLVLTTQKTNVTAKALYEACEWKQDIVFDTYERYFSA